MGFKEEFSNQPLQSLGIILAILYSLLAVFNIIIKKFYMYIRSMTSKQETIELEEKIVYPSCPSPTIGITAEELRENRILMDQQELKEASTLMEKKLYHMIHRGQHKKATGIIVNDSDIDKEMKYKLRGRGFDVKKSVIKGKCLGKSKILRTIVWITEGTEKILDFTEGILEAIDEVKK